MTESTGAYQVPSRVHLVVNPQSDHARSVAELAAQGLRSASIDVSLEPESSETGPVGLEGTQAGIDLKKSDLILVIGGDGTMLRATAIRMAVEVEGKKPSDADTERAWLASLDRHKNALADEGIEEVAQGPGRSPILQIKITPKKPTRDLF